MPNRITNSLWLYNCNLLNQAEALVERLKVEALPGFRYAQAIGPHLRHIIEHYTALLSALASAEGIVDYDARDRDMRVQTDPDATQAKLRELQVQFNQFSRAGGVHAHSGHLLSTRLQAGNRGELTVVVQTTLGRELLFLSSHTVHHFALVGQYSKAAGVDLGHDFGKAPATKAFELQAA